MARGDLTDAQWERLAPLLPPERSGKKGRPYAPHRPVLNGILWVLRTGAPWRDLPERYPPHGTCHGRLLAWQRSGLWKRLLQELQGVADARGTLRWEGAAADSTTVRAHQHAAGARRDDARRDDARRDDARRDDARRDDARTERSADRAVGGRRAGKKGGVPRLLAKRWDAAAGG